ncbi:galactosyltransferase, partial [Campylobacter jejuni]|nr:galactosyltransferase [Campylobacter jejuni]
RCFTYKLGLALIEANKKWYGGGYIKLWFKIKKLKYEFKNKN